ncbi:hypothetical protein D3C76_1738670 [compost metagenome]
MDAHRERGDTQIPGYLLVGLAGGDQAKHLPLARGQVGKCIVQDRVFGLILHHHFAFAYCHDGVGNTGRVDILADETVGTQRHHLGNNIDVIDH